MRVCVYVYIYIYIYIHVYMCYYILMYAYICNIYVLVLLVFTSLFSWMSPTPFSSGELLLWVVSFCTLHYRPKGLLIACLIDAPGSMPRRPAGI